MYSEEDFSSVQLIIHFLFGDVIPGWLRDWSLPTRWLPRRGILWADWWAAASWTGRRGTNPHCRHTQRKPASQNRSLLKTHIFSRNQ